MYVASFGGVASESCWRPQFSSIQYSAQLTSSTRNDSALASIVDNSPETSSLKHKLAK